MRVKVWVDETIGGYIEVEATSEEEALQKVRDDLDSYGAEDVIDEVTHREVNVWWTEEL